MLLEFKRASLVWAALFLGVALVMSAWMTHLDLRFHPTRFISGWILMTLLVGLTSLNWRKKLSFLPLGPVRSWVRIHGWTGLLAAWVFVLHTGFHLPNGIYEIILAALFAAVTVSGMALEVLSRVLPARSTSHHDPVIFEQLPGAMARLRQAATERMAGPDQPAPSAELASFFQEDLLHHFSKPGGIWRPLLRQGKRQRELERKADRVEPVLDERETAVLNEIMNMVREKDHLDTMYASQGLLKAWFFFHIPATYALLILAAFHGLLMHGFSGVA